MKFSVKYTLGANNTAVTVSLFEREDAIKRASKVIKNEDASIVRVYKGNKCVRIMRKKVHVNAYRIPQFGK